MSNEITKGRTVVEFRCQNIMGVKAAIVKPGKDSRVVIIGGKNGQGKTSFIKSLFSTFNGKKVLPIEPIRRGEEKGDSFVDFGDLKIWQTLTSKGRYLKCETPDGKKKSSGVQEYLNILIGKLAGKIPQDPVEFVRLGETPEGRRQQIKLLMELLGTDYDFEKEQEDKNELYAERRVVNRDIDSAIKTINEIGKPEEVGEEKSISELTEKLQQATEIQSKIAEGGRWIDGLKHSRDMHTQALNTIRAQIEELKAKAAKAELEIKKVDAKIEEAQEALKQLDVPDIDAIRQQISQAEEYNAEIRDAKQKHKMYDDLGTKADELKGRSKVLTQSLLDIEIRKEGALKNANLPVKGLGYDENGLTLNGLPFDQAAESHQIEVAIMLILETIPKNGIRILPIMHWRDLDSDAQKYVEGVLEREDAQAWAHAVMDSPDGNALWIEDGVLFEETTEPTKEPTKEGE